MISVINKKLTHIVPINDMYAILSFEGGPNPIWAAERVFLMGLTTTGELLPVSITVGGIYFVPNLMLLPGLFYEYFHGTEAEATKYAVTLNKLKVKVL